MEKDTRNKIITILIWMSGITIVRVLIFLLNYKGIEDPYGYLEGVFLRIETGERALSSGLCFAYTNALAKFMSFWGLRDDLVFWYQLFISTISLTFVLLGLRIFMDIKAAYITATLLAFDPYIVFNLKICSPEEYFLSYFSIAFFAIAVLYRYTRSHVWTRRTRNELIILCIGIYSGVMFAWNYLGFLALCVFIVVIIRNYTLFFDKDRLQHLSEGNDLDENLQVMTIPGQTIILLFGSTIGLFFTMLKYTGYSGLTVWEQLLWWKGLFNTLPYKTMDFDAAIAINVIAVTFIGIMINAIFMLNKKRMENKRLKMEELLRPMLLENESAFVSRNHKKQGESDSFFITADGRRVNYLENPLPIPKKRDKKSTKFDLEDLTKNRNYFYIGEIFGDLFSSEQNDSMKKAAEGIEKRVKLSATSRVNDTYASRVLNAALLNSNVAVNINDFDFDIKSDSDFDV